MPGVDLSTFAQALATALSIDLFPAQILCTTIIMVLALGPTLLLTRNKMAHLMVGFLVLSFCVAMAWLPVWIFVVTVLLIAFMFGSTILGVLKRG